MENLLFFYKQRKYPLVINKSYKTDNGSKKSHWSLKKEAGSCITV